MRLRRLAGIGLVAVSLAPAVADDAAPRRVFVSGHSLIDRPVLDDLARVSASLGRPLAWARRHGAGSSIAQRACREGHASTDDTSGPEATAGPYHTLVVTEQHDLMGALLWNGTIDALARLHDCFASAHPGIATWFYVPWISIDDKRDPSGWITYERAAAPLWRCIVAEANRRSAAARAGNRIGVIPIATALGALIEETGDATRLIEDAVHPTRLGAYALALLVEAATTGRAPAGAWSPADIAPETARTLQEFAGRTAATWARKPEPDPTECAERLRTQATEIFWPYMERAMWRPQSGLVAARWERLSKSLRWRWKLWRDPAWTPFIPQAETGL